MQFTKNIVITLEDIDQLGHVNNIVYLKWVQDVAIAHWNLLAPDELKNKYLWMITRHEIDYLRSCFLNSKLIAKTWVGNFDGAKCERFVEIVDTENENVMARVKTIWILLDRESKRPKRVSDEMVSIFK